MYNFETRISIFTFQNRKEMFGYSLPTGGLDENKYVEQRGERGESLSQWKKMSKHLILGANTKYNEAMNIYQITCVSKKRIEFLDSLGREIPLTSREVTAFRNIKKNANIRFTKGVCVKMIYTLGVDVGSTTSKCVILKDGKTIVAKSLVPSGTGTTGPTRAKEAVLEEAGLSLEDISYTLGTGYGRRAEGIADSDMSELSCHAMGAQFLIPNIKTVIDIGGQDIKVLGLENGVLTSFQMNDKCAAGTGRFLEVMANVLQVEVDDLGKLGGEAKSPVQISSTCTVFAESEVISQLSKGSQICDIIAGIHNSVASKVTGLVNRVGLRKPIMMTGGVSKNSDIIRAIEEQIGCNVKVSELSQYAGAIGAALYGYRKVN